MTVQQINGVESTHSNLCVQWVRAEGETEQGSYLRLIDLCITQL